jgi:hypothetical protein
MQRDGCVLLSRAVDLRDRDRGRERDRDRDRERERERERERFVRGEFTWLKDMIEPIEK